MSAKQPAPSFEELSRLIVSAIEDEQFFERAKLIPKVRSIIKGFGVNLNLFNYNKIETPTRLAKLQRAYEHKNQECKFWYYKFKELLPDQLEKTCGELYEWRKENGFLNEQKTKP